MARGALAPGIGADLSEAALRHARPARRRRSPWMPWHLFWARTSRRASGSWLPPPSNDLPYGARTPRGSLRTRTSRSPFSPIHGCTGGVVAGRGRPAVRNLRQWRLPTDELRARLSRHRRPLAPARRGQALTTSIGRTGVAGASTPTPRACGTCCRIAADASAAPCDKCFAKADGPSGAVLSCSSFRWSTGLPDT